MKQYDFDFLDLRNDKRSFLLYLVQKIESLLLSNSTDVAVSSIEVGATQTTIGMSSSATHNCTELIINFSYIENAQVEEKIPKKFWQVFSKTKYQTIIHKNFRKGKLILSYNDNSVSNKWKPSNIKVYVI